MISMESLLIGVLIPLLAAVLSWSLSQHSAKVRDREKLVFRIDATPDSEIDEPELRTKTSASDYSIEISNLGQKPVILNYFRLQYKKRIICDCFLEEKDRHMEPYQSIRYILMEQDFNSLSYFCGKTQIKKCTVMAYTVDEKRIRGTLDVEWVSMRERMRVGDGRAIAR